MVWTVWQSGWIARFCSRDPGSSLTLGPFVSLLLLSFSLWLLPYISDANADAEAQAASSLINGTHQPNASPCQPTNQQPHQPNHTHQHARRRVPTHQPCRTTHTMRAYQPHHTTQYTHTMRVAICQVLCSIASFSANG